MTTTTTTTTTVALSNGERLAVAARWRGHTLCIHAPIRDNAETATRGVWIVSDWVTGLRAGTFRGPLRDAVKLARVWDEPFAVALAESRSLAQWPQRLAWQRQCDGFANSAAGFIQSATRLAPSSLRAYGMNRLRLRLLNPVRLRNGRNVSHGSGNATDSIRQPVRLRRRIQTGLRRIRTRRRRERSPNRSRSTAAPRCRMRAPNAARAKRRPLRTMATAASNSRQRQP